MFKCYRIVTETCYKYKYLKNVLAKIQNYVIIYVRVNVLKYYVKERNINGDYSEAC